MSQDSPAVVLFDDLGNPVGVSFDGTSYRLQVENIVNKIIPHVSTLNSSSTPLLALGVFQGVGEDVSGFVSIDVTVLPDVISAVNGLLFEWSQDGVTYDYSDGAVFTVEPNAGQYFSLAPRAKYFRCSYTNGAINQTKFQISTVYYPIERSTYAQNLALDVASQQSTSVVKSVLAAQKQGGATQTNNYTNLQCTTTGFLKASIDTVVTPAIIFPEIIQVNSVGPTTGTHFQASFINPTIINNAIIVLVMQGNSGSGASYVLTDSQGNLYIKGPTFANENVGQIDAWFTNSIGGTNDIIVTAFTSTATVVMVLYEVSGLLIGAPILDAAIFATGTGINLNTGQILTNHDNEFCISAFITTGGSTISPGAGWTQDISGPGFFTQNQIQDIAGPITGTATSAVSESFIGVLITFLSALVSRPLVTDAAGRLQTVIPYLLPTFSILNSTIAPLPALGIFQGTGEDVSLFLSINIAIMSDTTSAVHGIVFAWSQDNITYDYQEYFSIQANIGEFYSFAPRAKYFKLTYTNGATAQTKFALSVAYYPFSKSTPTKNLDIDVPSQEATEIVRSILAAQRQDTQTYTNLQATTSGLLKVSVDTAVFPALIVPAVVQARNAGPVFATTISVTLSSHVKLNNTIVVVIIQGQGTFNGTYTLLDTLGNLYLPAAGTNNITPSGSSIDIWYAASITTGVCTVTATNFSQTTNVVMQVYEVSSLLIANPVDKLILSANLGTSLSVGPVVTNANGEFCIAVYGTDVASLITPGAGWTSDLSALGFGCFSQIQSVAGSLTGTATAASLVNSIDLLVTFLPAVTSKPLQVNQSGNLVVISEISDGTNGPASVKPPSTAAVATDKALVVAISPNNPVTTSTVRPSTNTTSSVSASVTNVVLLASNSIRLGATVYNDSSALLYIKLGANASFADFTVRLLPYCYYECPYSFTGEIDAIWNSTGGFARVGELTL